MSRHYPRTSCDGVRQYEKNKKLVVVAQTQGRCGSRVRAGEKVCRYCGTTR